MSDFMDRRDENNESENPEEKKGHGRMPKNPSSGKPPERADESTDRLQGDRLPEKKDDAAKSELSIDFVLRALNNNSMSAWDYLDNRYRQTLCAYARLQMSPKFDAWMDPEDMVQRAWLKVLSAARDPKFQFEYRERGSLLRWLTTQIRRIVIDESERLALARRQPESSDLPPDELLAQIEDHEPDDSTLEKFDLIARAIRRISPTFRPTVIGRLFEGLSYEEIAEREGKKPATIRKQYERGIDLLKGYVDPDDLACFS